MKRDEEEYGEEEEEGDFENEWLLNDKGKYEDYEKIFLPNRFKRIPWGIEQISYRYPEISFLLGGTPNKKTTESYYITFLEREEKQE